MICLVTKSKRREIGFAIVLGLAAITIVVLNTTIAQQLLHQQLLAQYKSDSSRHFTTTTDEAAVAGGDWRQRWELSEVFHRLEGGGSNNDDGSSSWKVIDWKHPFSVDEESSFTCTWTHFRSYLSGESAPMCVHDNDIVSNFIKSNRRWPDCDPLPVLWNNKGVNNNHDDDKSVVYVEIGANIGSCVMEMLLSTNASIVAFEPHPRNLYNIKKTVSLLDETYQNRLALFPVGLGNASITSTIYSGSDNLGNSVIGQIIRDYPNQAFEEKNQFTVNAERLDSILAANKMKVGLMKMDAQGFECSIVEGMGDVAGIIDVLKFEYSPMFLHSHGCFDLVSQLMKYLDIYTTFNNGEFSGLTDNTGADVIAETNAGFDLFASKRVAVGSK